MRAPRHIVGFVPFCALQNRFVPLAKEKGA